MTLTRLILVTALGLYACGVASGQADAGDDLAPSRCETVEVGPVPESVRSALGLDPLYEKYVDAGGIPIVSSAGVSDAALLIARDIVLNLLANRGDARDELIAARVRVGIMTPEQVTTDMPEHSDLYEAFPGTDWDTRARGLGATLARPLTSVGEENVLQLASDRYRGESILVHEFGHTVWDLGVARAAGGSDMVRRLQQAYDAAIEAGLFANTYADDNVGEYWAEGVQDWFDTNLEADPPNGIHNQVDTRAELRTYDPALAALLLEVFGDGTWRPFCVP